MNDFNIKLSKILCPIDFSEYSYHALNYGITLAEQFNGEIHIIHVLPVLPFSHVPYHYHEDNLVLEEKAELSAKKELKKICSEKIPSKIKSSWELIKDDAPFIGITNYAKENGIDLIVIATHGYSGIKHIISGSTAERVVRHANCPVLSVKNPEHEFIKS